MNIFNQARRTLGQSDPNFGAPLDTTHGPILYVEGITVSFDGFRARLQDRFSGHAERKPRDDNTGWKGLPRQRVRGAGGAGVGGVGVGGR